LAFHIVVPQIAIREKLLRKRHLWLAICGCNHKRFVLSDK
jgi:hypothetical protein